MALRVVVHSTRAVRDGKSLNHWTIFLLLAEDQSVRINMRDKTPEEWKYGLPDDADYGEPGSMELTSHLYQISTSAIRYWDFRCLASHRVDEFINTLIRNGRGYYTMAVGGSGCRYWV
ncbi:hypothetical protein Dda_7408 [Drechslerella dactyloides]|uniref:DUF7770 domain-containing protein n=1 Tax=Drechslerella dactyloides TaxID=74499 RepID=A0AAD6NFJ5_DREDA|nr:hypothetical protein Dda_7408 [Drechslerella dactyloides]